MDQTDVDSCFYHNIFFITQCQHRKARVSWDSNKTLFADKLFQFCHLKTQQRYFLQEDVKISEREFRSLVDCQRDFFEFFDQASKSLQVPSPIFKTVIGFKKLKENLLNHYYRASSSRGFSSRFEIKKPCIFSIQKFDRQSSQLILTEILYLNHHHFYHLYENQ